MPSSHHRPPLSVPPPPEWRVPAAPPRPPRQANVATPPPPPPPPPSYNPSTGSYAPSAAGVNTATWGVNYNRQHHTQSPAPPLPPRPSSTTGQHSNTQSPLVNAADPYQPPVSAPGYGGPGQVPPGDYYQQWTSNHPYVPQQPATSLSPPPPPPPPGPPVYDSSTYQNPAHPLPAAPPTQQTWNQSPSATPAHNFYQKVSSIQSEGSSFQPPEPVHVPATAPPIPPKTSPLAIPPGASALGFGGPSDWEHLSPVPGEIDDVDVFKRRDDHPFNTGHGLTPGHGISTTTPIPSSHSPTSSFSNPDFAKPGVGADAFQHHSKHSPVSPTDHHDFQPPAHPTRMDTTGSDYTTVSMAANSENIDGVIEAWNKPLSVENKPPNVQQSPRVEPAPVSPHLSPSPIETASVKRPDSAQSAKGTQIGRESSAVGANGTARAAESPRPPPTEVDRYGDLDPWSQSSLERYVAMLRKEAVADSDEERFKLFTTFMAKETKLREILYSIEHDASNADVPQQVAVSQTPTKEPEESKPTPTPDESGLIPVETEEGYFAPDSKLDEDGDGSYSPGGRPILPRLHTPAPATLHRSASNPGGHKYTASHTVAAHAPRSTTVPPMIDQTQKMYSPLTTNPPQPIYIPFRYTEGPQRGSDNLSLNLPASQAYSALRQAQAESGRVMADIPAPTESNRKRAGSSASVQIDPDETFVGLIREKSVNYKKKPQASTPPPLPPSLRQGKPPGPVEELRNVTSSPVNKQSESLWHITVRKDLEKYSNDFAFVREIFKPWEAASKARKEALDKKRIQRQEESEVHIDALFNGKEIGYADINILEEEFRQTEARAQLEEERQELEDFIVNVYNAVDKRLEEEISTLKVHYDSALSQLDRENSNKDEGADKHSISHTMKIVNETHHKIEMRHHKRLEIALDRERRRKKAERRPLVFMGDSAALKKLDHEFDQMEKQNILEAARARDERANKLMDIFDDAIMRGLGENQSILDDLSVKVNRVDEPAIRTAGLPDAEIEQILRSVHTLVESLRKDSESILHSFGVADSALNNADYSVSVAEARYANAEPDVFRQLEMEKKKEDAKIQENVRTKLQSVRVGPAKITVGINDALRTLGKTPFPDPPVFPKDVIPDGHSFDVSLPNPNPVRPVSTMGVAARKMDADPEHRERLKKALEDAKKRNAARQRSPSAASVSQD
ncbi:hypothetical protein BDV18DRAFT_128613 [Aspergillus unguis]